MKVTVERAELLKSLGHVHRVVERRNTIPILANVLIKAEAKAKEGQVNRISLAAAIEGMKLHSGVTEIDEP